MAKIHITGNSGSGKTVFANQLGKILKLPVFGLDKIVWQPGWIKTPRSVRLAKEIELASKSDWIIEGVSKHIRQAADVVVFLDVGRLTSLKRSMKRNVRYLFRGRPELPEKCPEITAVWQQIVIIYKFEVQTRPSILEDLAQHHGQVFVACTTPDADRISEQIIAEAKRRS